MTQPSLELHGGPTGNCRRAAIALEEAGLPFAVRLLDLRAGEHLGPDYLALNPAGKVPTLVGRSAGGTFVLTQSNAILMYAADRTPGTLLPETTGAKAVALERFFYFITDVIAPSHAAFALSNAGDREGGRLMAERSIKALQAAERFLEISPYLAGERFSAADIAAVTICTTLKSEIDWLRVPRLERWYAEVRDRPSVLIGSNAFG